MTSTPTQTSSNSSMDAQQYRQKAEDARREDDSKSTPRYAPRRDLSNGLVHENKTITLQADSRVFAAGRAITSRDSIIQQRLRFTSGNKLPARISVFSYNSLNETLRKIDQEYTQAYTAYDSAIYYFKKGNQRRARLFALHACKSRKSYINAYFLASTCARNLEQYDQALNQLEKKDAIVTENQKGALCASKAEIYYLKGDETTALTFLQQASDKKALGWVYYMEEKYGIKLNKQY